MSNKWYQLCVRHPSLRRQALVSCAPLQSPAREYFCMCSIAVSMAVKFSALWSPSRLYHALYCISFHKVLLASSANAAPPPLPRWFRYVMQRNHTCLPAMAISGDDERHPASPVITAGRLRAYRTYTNTETVEEIHDYCHQITTEKLQIKNVLYRQLGKDDCSGTTQGSTTHWERSPRQHKAQQRRTEVQDS